MSTCKPYPSDVSDEEWAFVAPYLTLLPEDAGQRRYELREVFNGLRHLIKSGALWCWIPHDLLPWIIVYQQTRRWREAGAFDAVVADLRLLLRLGAGRSGQPSTVLLDSRTPQSTPESGARADYDGHKRRRLEGSCGGGYLGTPPGAARHPRQRTGSRPGRHAGDRRPRVHRLEPTAAAQAEGIELQVVKLPTARQGFVLLAKHWVVERSFAWASRFRRLARDYERLPTMLTGLHFAAFACLMLHQFIHTWSP